MPSLLRLISATVLVLLSLPAQASKDPLARGTEDHEAQVIGWSADEQRFAVRLYLRDPSSFERRDDEPIACAGYETHEGKPLRGGIVVLAYEGSRLLATFPILDRNTCTPLDEARKRLEVAKKKLGARGIDLDAPGKSFRPVLNSPTVTVEHGPQAPYSLEYVERIPSQETNPKSGDARGTAEQELHLRKGDARQKVHARKTSFTYSTRMSGHRLTGVDQVVASPSGKTLVVLGHEVVGNMASRRKSLRLLGVLSWSGEALQPR